MKKSTQIHHLTVCKKLFLTLRLKRNDNRIIMVPHIRFNFWQLNDFKLFWLAWVLMHFYFIIQIDMPWLNWKKKHHLIIKTSLLINHQLSNSMNLHSSDTTSLLRSSFKSFRLVVKWILKISQVNICMIVVIIELRAQWIVNI